MILLFIFSLFFHLSSLPSYAVNSDKVIKENSKNKRMETKKIYFAGGCFWGTEHFLRQVRGVQATQVGYANGDIEEPTYQQVCTGKTGFAETVEVVYNPHDVPLKLLVELFFKTIDPTSLNRQGNDRGSQYRTGIYYTSSEQLPIIASCIDVLRTAYQSPIVIELMPLENFYKAEDYHQDYLVKNADGYCHIDPSLFALAKKANPKVTKKKYVRYDEATLQVKLTPMQYAVTQRNATEPAFQNSYWDEYRKGIYVDITTGEPLFISSDKFDSGCGWPSFTKPISDSLINEKKDDSHGMKRIEVRSKSGDAHLGHVFTDGPTDKGGLRYCINSASLRFIPKEKMKEEGYADYLPLLKD